MQINRVQNNYNPQFNGMIKIRNFVKNGEITKFETSQELDKGLADVALKNVFNGDWANTGERKLERNKLGLYIDIIRQTLGISIPRVTKEIVPVKLKHFDNGYSIKAGEDYQLTHIRDDRFIWE